MTENIEVRMHNPPQIVQNPFLTMKFKIISRTAILFFLIFFFISSFNAQTPQTIEKQLEEARKLSLEDASRAISLYDKLLEESQKIKFDKGILESKGALATVYFNNGEYEKVIEISDGVEALALRFNDFAKLAGIYRNLAASYSMLRLNDQALKTLDKAKIYAGKIENKTVRYYTTALIYDSYSVCIGEASQDVDKTIFYINESLGELEKISDREKRDYVEAKYDLTGFQYFRLADLYFGELKQNSKADKYYRKALKIYENPEYNILPSNKVILYSSLSDFYYAQKEFKKSVIYGEKALDLTRKYDQPEIRKDIYNTLFKACLETGQKDESKRYADLYTKLNDSLKKVERKSVNTSINKIISENRKDSERDINKIILIGVGMITFFSLIGCFLWRQNEKQLHKRYEKLIKSLQEDMNKETLQPEQALKNPEENSMQKAVNIAPETVEILLAGLDKFEISNRFTKKEVNLGYLTNYLGTNSKYLTEILREYKRKSFSQYINDLRIDYIMKLLYSEPKYREYKIDYLAKECGFSSRNIFTRAFKNKTGMLPSYFIENLSKDYETSEKYPA